MSYCHVIAVIALQLLASVALVTNLDNGQYDQHLGLLLPKLPNQPALCCKFPTRTFADAAPASDKDQYSHADGHADGHDVAWFMTFRNSGTSLTLKCVRHVTMGSTGSNDGHDTALTDYVVSMYGDGHPLCWIDPHSLEANA